MSHGALLRQHSDDPILASHVMHDYTKADLEPKARSMLDFPFKLTREPWSMMKGDAGKLHAAGLGDEEILSVSTHSMQF